MDNSYIGWIVPTYTDFSAAEQYLEVCAATNESIYDTARLMIERLQWKYMQLKLCFVGAFGYTSTFYCQPAVGDCVLSLHNFSGAFYRISGGNVTGTSLHNASLLLQAVNSIVDHQTGYSTGDNTMGYIRREFNPEEADIARFLCCSQGFDLVPCMSVTGLCGYYMGDDNVQWIPFATQQAAATISNIITRIGGELCY
ncbi:hypothetical protein V8C37DRAFT_411353 [Trichoderma ceciliae]